MRCAIWYHLSNLKNLKNIHEEVLILISLPATLLKLTLLHGCFSRFLNWTNGTKSRNAPQMILIFRFSDSHFPTIFKISVMFLCDNSLQALSAIDCCFKDVKGFLDPALVISLYSSSKLLHIFRNILYPPDVLLFTPLKQCCKVIVCVLFIWFMF